MTSTSVDRSAPRASASTRARRAVAALSLFVAAFAPAIDARAEAPKRSDEAAHDRARARFLAGDYSGALIESSKAYALTGDPRMLWNMAACEKKLSRFDRVQ